MTIPWARLCAMYVSQIDGQFLFFKFPSHNETFKYRRPADDRQVGARSHYRAGTGDRYADRGIGTDVGSLSIGGEWR